MLKLRQRLLARHIARDAWIASRGSGDEAKILAEADCRVRGLDPATIMLIIQLAMLLWEYWSKKKIDEPSTIPSALEPVNWEADDE